MTEHVAKAVEELRLHFEGHQMSVQEDGDGGAWVIIEEVPIDGLYTFGHSWVGFRITFQYPHADVYPHFVRGDLQRLDGRPLGEGIQAGQAFLGRPALQLSRRSNRLNPRTDTALLKLHKVLLWFRTHP